MPNKRKIHLIAGSTTLLLLIIVLFSRYSGVSLEDSTSDDEDEKAIISLLYRFNTAKTERNPEEYLACLCEDGSFMYGGSLMVSKDDLSLMISNFWADLDSGEMQVFPSSRESLNGNFLDGQLYDPHIQINGNEAEATITFATPVIRWKTTLFLSLRKERGSWLIESFVWDMG